MHEVVFLLLYIESRIHFLWLVVHRESLCWTNALVWFLHNSPDVFDCSIIWKRNNPEDSGCLHQDKNRSLHIVWFPQKCLDLGVSIFTAPYSWRQMVPSRRWKLGLRKMQRQQQQLSQRINWPFYEQTTLHLHTRTLSIHFFVVLYTTKT